VQQKKHALDAAVSACECRGNRQGRSDDCPPESPQRLPPRLTVMPMHPPPSCRLLAAQPGQGAPPRRQHLNCGCLACPAASSLFTCAYHNRFYPRRSGRLRRGRQRGRRRRYSAGRSPLPPLHGVIGMSQTLHAHDVIKATAAAAAFSHAANLTVAAASVQRPTRKRPTKRQATQRRAAVPTPRPTYHKPKFFGVIRHN